MKNMASSSNSAQNTVPIEIISEVMKCCTLIGNESTLLAIKQAQSSVNDTKKISEFIVSTVIKEFNLSRYQVLSANSRGDSKVAQMFIYIMHRSHLGFSYDQITEWFDKKYKTVWNRMKQFESLSETHKQDLATLKTFNKINEKVVEFINKTTTKTEVN